MRNREYWEKRVLEDDERRTEQEDKCISSITKVFEDCINYCEKQIYSFYAKYAESGVISQTNARKLLTAKERTQFRERVAELRKTVRTDEQDKELKQLIARIKISRQQSLLSLLNAKIKEVSSVTVDEVKGTLETLTTDELLHAAFNLSQGIGFAVDFDRFTDTQIQALISTGYDGRNFSSKIWTNTDTLSLRLQQLIPRMFLLGDSVEDVSRELRKQMQSQVKYCDRIVRTESTYVASQVDVTLYKKTGVEKYEFCATLDNRTSQMCRDMDGKVFKMSEAAVGVNLPPLHPYCRSTTIPVADISDLDAMRLAKGANGKYYTVPQTMKYHEWEKKYV